MRLVIEGSWKRSVTKSTGAVGAGAKLSIGCCGKSLSMSREYSRDGNAGIMKSELGIGPSMFEAIMLVVEAASTRR